MGDTRPIRKRLKRRENDGEARFVTFSCQRRLPLLSNRAIAGLFVWAMARAHRERGLELFAWVIMPEHVHLLVRPQEGTTLTLILRSLKMSVARRVLAHWTELRAPILERIDDGHGNPRFWQKGGGFDRNVRNDAELCREIRYIHQNPVKRGLVQRPEDWPWSSVRWWMGAREGEVECDRPQGDMGAWDRWKGYV